MEENLNQNIASPAEPVVVTQPPPTNQPPFGRWWKVGVLVISALFVAGGLFFAGYQYSQKQKTTALYPTPTPKAEICIQVITPARNPQTGECKDFPTPCDVPSGWTTVNSCSTTDETANWKTYTSEDKTFSFKYPPEWIYETKEITLMLKYKGKERKVISVSAGIPLTEEQRKAQNYININDAPKTYNNFLLLYATSPDFKNLNLDNPAEDLLSTAMVKENIGYQKDITLKNNITAKEVGYGCQAYCIDIYFKNNNTIFDFSTGPNAETNIATLRQILSTFKFLE